MADEHKQDKAQEQAAAEAGVATAKQNDNLEHSQGGATTRDDPHDLGVPMLPGDPSEPVGPEDALGRGPKRGDYGERVPGNPHQSTLTEDGGEPVVVDGQTVDYKPVSRMEAQKPRTEDIGDESGAKGGVDTDPVSV